MKTEDLLKSAADGNTHGFYLSSQWRKLRDEVLALDHNECQICKARGKYTCAAIIHHVNHLKDYPQYGLSIWMPDGTRNLISVCKSCHEELHPEVTGHTKTQAEIKIPERWD